MGAAASSGEVTVDAASMSANSLTGAAGSTGDAVSTTTTTELEKIKDPEFWPDGMVVRRFFRGKPKEGTTNNGGLLTGDARVPSA